MGKDYQLMAKLALVLVEGEEVLMAMKHSTTEASSTMDDCAGDDKRR
jgi:hypothetical protein